MVTRDASDAKLVIANFGKFWVVFKYFQVVSDGSWVVLDGFCLVAGGFKCLQVVLDDFGQFFKHASGDRARNNILLIQLLNYKYIMDWDAILKIMIKSYVNLSGLIQALI